MTSNLLRLSAVLAVILCSARIASGSELRAHALFADGLVLQTTDDGGQGSAISGTARPHATVTLSVDGRNVSSVVVDAGGNWLHPVAMASSGPHVLSLSDGASILEAHDVWFGDVFICSGQSNMVFPIGAGNDYEHGIGGQAIEDAIEVGATTSSVNVRAWVVPGRKKGSAAAMNAAQLGRFGALGGQFELTEPLTNLTGGCNLSAMCKEFQPPPPPPNCAPVCDASDELVHNWIKLDTTTVRPVSAVCYVAIHRAMQKYPGRAAGVVLAYVGGTPVGAWTDDASADETCHVKPSGAASVPCDATKAACPQSLYNEFVAPVFKSGARFRAALWYQGEANSDEGYHRSRREYACQFELLIRSWRAALGYKLPFSWVLLHPWGDGGGAGDGGFDGAPMGSQAQAQIRLAQSDVASANLGATTMAVNLDGCECDYNGTARAKRRTCNLHPGYKSTIGRRLGDQVLAVAFGAANASPRPLVRNVTRRVSADGGRVDVTFHVDGDGASSTQLGLLPIHDASSVWLGRRCEYTDGMAVMNASFDGGGSGLVNGTVRASRNTLVATFKKPFLNGGGQSVGDNVTSVHAVGYAMQNVLPCVVANAAGHPLAPLIWEF